MVVLCLWVWGKLCSNGNWNRLIGLGFKNLQGDKGTVWDTGVDVDKGKHSNDWVAHSVACHMVSDSLPSTKLWEDIMDLSDPR